MKTISVVVRFLINKQPIISMDSTSDPWLFVSGI